MSRRMAASCIWSALRTRPLNTTIVVLFRRLPKDRRRLSGHRRATSQLTLAGWPLYRHRDDDGMLATAGQNGADGMWFVVTPKGEKATPA
jgi:hypothetical protein